MCVQANEDSGHGSMCPYTSVCEEVRKDLNCNYTLLQIHMSLILFYVFLFQGYGLRQEITFLEVSVLKHYTDMQILTHRYS